MCNMDGEQSVDWCYTHRMLRADEEQDAKADDQPEDHPDE